MRNVACPFNNCKSMQNEIINSAFEAEDFHLSVFKPEEKLEKEIFWAARTM